jgi:hypothetical protein
MTPTCCPADDCPVTLPPRRPKKCDSETDSPACHDDQGDAAARNYRSSEAFMVNIEINSKGSTCAVTVPDLFSGNRHRWSLLRPVSPPESPGVWFSSRAPSPPVREVLLAARPPFPRVCLRFSPARKSRPPFLSTYPPFSAVWARAHLSVARDSRPPFLLV